MKKLSALIILISWLGATPAAHAVDGEWSDRIIGAIRNGNYNQINIIAASHPESQGAIAMFLLKESQAHKNNPDQEVKIFAAATPFVGRIPAADAEQAGDIIRALLKFADDPTVQRNNPRDAGNVFLTALFMSSQPNLVANDPNLHAEVLEAADDFVKTNPQDADKKLLDEISLAQAGGAPEATPRGVINPSSD
jgi:hypothetical protein